MTAALIVAERTAHQTKNTTTSQTVANQYLLHV